MNIIYIESNLKDIINTYPEAISLVINHDPDDSVMTGVIQCGDYGGGFKKHKYIKVYAAILDDKIIGWSWLFNYHRVSINTETKYIYRQRALAYMTFVKEEYRRMGVGSTLYLMAKETSKLRHRSLHVFPWDKRSRKFYRKVFAKNKFRFLD